MLRLLARVRLLALAASTACGAPAPVHEHRTPRPAPDAGAVLAPELARPLEAIAEEVEGERVRQHVPGLALAIVKDDALVFARGFGLADVENGRAVTSATLFAIGSTTKAFTATLAGMLADEGKLSFDDPITRHLPWFTLPVRGPPGAVATLRDLLAHRTGFAHMDMLWYGGRARAAEVLRTAVRAEPMAPLREKFLYNNVMFLAAGEACAAAGGRPWEELVRERFFEPLGMSSTNSSRAAAQRDPDLALGYVFDEERGTFERRPMRDLHAIAPAGAINSSVLDLARWVRCLLARGAFEGRRLVSEQSLGETWKPHNQVAAGVGYGLGWMLHRWQGQAYVEHGGNIDGFAAEVALLPESQLGLVLLANVGATPLQGAIGPLVFRRLLGAPAEPDGGAPLDEGLDRYTGVYVANFFQFRDAEIEVVVRNDRLAVDVPGQTVYELEVPGADGKRPFALVPEQIQVSFVEDRNGSVVELVLHQSGFTFECPRAGYTPPAEAAPEELARYLGSYHDPLTTKTFSVVLRNNRLAVDYPEQMVYELRAPDEDERWVFRAIDQLAVVFHLQGDGRVSSLTFHERGTERECPRVSGGAAALPTPAEVTLLRRSDDFERRLSELGACRLSGSIRFPYCGLSGTTTTTFEGECYREETDLLPFLVTRTAFDGTTARYDSSLAPAQELAGKNRDQARAGSPAVFFGDWSRRFDRAEVKRVTESGGKETIQVELALGEAPPILVHVDAGTGDLIRAEVRELVDGFGALPKSVTFEDWREVEGLRLPMRVITEDDTSGRVVVEYSALETGLALEPGFFAPAPELGGGW